MAKKAKAKNTTGKVRKRRRAARKRRRAARKRKRVEHRLKLSARRIIPQSELTPEELKHLDAWARGLTLEELKRLSARPERGFDLATVAEKLDQAAARRDRLSTADAVAPAPSRSAPTLPAKRINSEKWVVETLGQLNKAGQIPAKITKTALAQRVVDLITAARAVNIPIHPLKRDYIRIRLEKWIGCWPIPRNWGTTRR